MIRPICIQYVDFLYLHICEDKVNCVVNCCIFVYVLFDIVFCKCWMLKSPRIRISLLSILCVFLEVNGW